VSYIIFKMVMIVSSIVAGNYFSEDEAKVYLLTNSKHYLYESSGSYIFNGASPNNYILFDDELWRIIKIENDGSLKIMKNESIGEMAFDNKNSNRWETSSLKKYLNDVFYNELSDVVKDLINNNVEIITFDDYLKANANFSLCGSEKLYFENDSRCVKTNYMNFMNYNLAIWTKTLDDANDSSVYYVGNTYFGDSRVKDMYDVFPVVYLKENVKLKGHGSKIYPYFISQ